MAKILGLWPSAIWAAGRSTSFREWEREVRSVGLGARSSEMLKLWRQATGVVAKSKDEPFRNQYEVPRPEHRGQWPVKNKTGIAQTVTLVYRDKTTGEYKTTYWRTVTPNGITRANAVATAIAAYAATADRYNQELAGAVHTSATDLVPWIGA